MKYYYGSKIATKNISLDNKNIVVTDVLLKEGEFVNNRLFYNPIKNVKNISKALRVSQERLLLSNIYKKVKEVSCNLEEFKSELINTEYCFIRGKSKGKGFQGVIKRFSFKGNPSSHGHSRKARTGGTTGTISSGRKKGKKMPGNMGFKYQTVKLKVLEINNNVISFKGSIPGPKNNLIKIKTIV